MAITKETKIGTIEVVGDYKKIQVATDTVYKDNGVEVSRTRHRHVLYPGSDITNEHAEVQTICNAVWTPEIITAWNNYKAEQEAQMPE